MWQDCRAEFNEKTDFRPETALLKSIRNSLCSDLPLAIPEMLRLPFSPSYSQVYLTLFQRGLKPLRWGAKKNSLPQTLQRVITKLKSMPELEQFAVNDPYQCRLLFEMVTAESPCNIQELTGQAFTENRFEPGITGVKYIYEGVTRYFMPTDAVVHSIMSVPQLLNFLAKKTGIAKQTPSISKRTQLMRQAPIIYKLLQGVAFVSYAEGLLPLYRGYPAPLLFSKNIVLNSTLNSIDWLLANMQPDGRFLYYYDPYLDTQVDFEHPKMLNPLYNNILRHSGGTITLLRGYELTHNPKYLLAAKNSLDFLISTFQTHTVNQQFACYPFFYQKAKLGGAGLGLVALMHYYRHTQDECYRMYIDGLVRHILSRVADDGELIGYYIHPQFNNGEPLIDPPDAVKKQLFSFYYPGEALLGLALYDRYIQDIDPALRLELRRKSRLALDFLVTTRPIKYPELFLSLPSDAWLMQAIEEWVKIAGFQQQAYYDFVFNEARILLAQMYTAENSPYPDYIGGFYYQYGDHVYQDASRCEGLIAAYYLADYLGNSGQAELIWSGLLKAAKGLLRTRHTPESTYAHRYPEKALHSFRFKLTRQWVRVDSVQHAACFYARLLPLLVDVPEVGADLTVPVDQAEFKLLKRIAQSGFSDVYQACDAVNEQQAYAIKLLNHQRFINFIHTEIAILQAINTYPDAVKFHGSGKFDQRIYLKFDYVPGDNLRDLIRRQGPFDKAEALKLLQDITHFLKFTRHKRILHLDIKPQNIVYHQGKYTLIDWGLAKQGSSVRTLTRKGDPIYLAPEFYQGYRGFASEIYALGCVLYFVLVGRPIFGLRTRDTLIVKMAAHCYRQPDFPANLSPKLQILLGRMLDKNPHTRADLNTLEHFLLNPDSIEANQALPKPVRMDCPDELTLLQQLATDGVAYAQTLLGSLYQEGEQLPQQDTTAAYWFEQAAQQGFAAGQTRLGLAYLRGMGLAFDFVKALYYLQLAASQGYASAQYYLGEAYELGLGTPTNLEQAINWYTQAAQNAHKKAYQALNRLSQPVPTLVI